MEVVQIYTHSAFRNFSYILPDKEKRRAIVVDPYSSEMILDWIESYGYEIEAIINTHEHWDHTCGNEGLQAHCLGEIYCHPLARGKIPTATSSLQLNARLPWAEGWIEILDTPGHTLSHICLLVGYRDFPESILTGDTLFNAGVGNCKNGGDVEKLYESVTCKLGRLPDSIKVYPGHDYWDKNLRFTLSIEPSNEKAIKILEEYKKEQKKGKFLVSNLGLEKEISLFFRSNHSHNWNGELWKSQNIAKFKNRENWDEKRIFTELRRLRDSW